MVSCLREERSEVMDWMFWRVRSEGEYFVYSGTGSEDILGKGACCCCLCRLQYELDAYIDVIIRRGETWNEIPLDEFEVNAGRFHE